MLNINDIVSQTDLYNLHTHTQFCDARAPMEDFVREAIALHFTHLGFTPHSPTTAESPCNMSRASVHDYFQEMERLRGIYGGQIHLYTGMEIDYVNDFGPSDSYFQSLPLDYSIGSVHFIPAINNPSLLIDIDGHYDAFKKKMHNYFEDDIEYVVRTFFAQSMQMVEKGGFDIVGHFDKIGLNASLYSSNLDEEPWFDKLVLQMFESIMDCHLTVEINTKSWLQHNRFFPNIKYFAMLKKYKAPVVINSDAHYPTLLNSGRNEARRLLDSLG